MRALTRDAFLKLQDEARERARRALEIYEGRVPPSLPVVTRLARDYQRASSAPRRCSFCGEYCTVGSGAAGICRVCSIPFDDQNAARGR